MTKSLSIVGNIKRLDDSVELMTEAINIAETYTEVNVQEITLAASATDDAIDFGGIATAQLFLIVPTYVTSGTSYLTCKINGGSEDIKFGKLLAIGGKSANGITSISITNPDTSNDVQLKVYMA